MTEREYQWALLGLLMSFRAQPTDTLWIHACHLKYHSKFPEVMIDKAKRMVLNEREKTTNQSTKKEAQ